VSEIERLRGFLPPKDEAIRLAENYVRPFVFYLVYEATDDV
jgi:hypothetical protein